MVLVLSKCTLARNQMLVHCLPASGRNSGTKVVNAEVIHLSANTVWISNPIQGKKWNALVFNVRYQCFMAIQESACV